MYSPRQKILWFAFSTRIAVIIIQAISNNVIPDHDANVFISPEDPALRHSFADTVVDKLLGGMKRWDAQYFIHIAQYGYTYENCLAFFPLFPLIVRYVAYGISSMLGSFLNFHSALLISFTLVNLVMFIKSADILHRLSLRILRSECKAYKSVILYCVNPASIFFSAPYSETLFAWMSFYTMLKCTDNETLRFANIDIMSGVPAGFSMIARSNGIVNLGFIFYASFKNVIEKTLPEIVYKYKTLKRRIILPFLLLPLFTSFVALMLTVIIALIPFLLVQVYNYFKYCIHSDHNLPEFLSNTEYVLPGTAESPWCNSTLPLSYSYIQSHYWDVGFLKYYKFKQIPNFMLASPILFLILYHCMSYIKNNLRLCFRLGLRGSTFNYGYSNRMAYRPKQYSKGFGANDPALFVYVVHAMFLTVFSILFVHIQVSTRLLASASPILYWICSSRMNVGPTPTSDQNTINEHFRRIGIGKRIPSHHLSIANLEGVDNMYSKWKTFLISRRMPDFQSRLIQYYFVGYFVIGTVFFSNFYPWT
ncbi:GPI mannosyltransferase 2 [Pectinophora gossypiella]|uniref:GPI mannosyltransferase 2 n=1 Tax=Pectinophora gossypiella TaxID=13191 RepID=A0A1E1WIH6_PECGO|nr:GPI mannosyltransferase 2 [Pectinophora gossypiella]XP_049872018.1 GPI mannosyltransferase 2 [Pectinophora gossypiella]